MVLRFALGNYYDKNKRYEEAYEHIKNGNNQAKQMAPAYSGSSNERLIDSIIAQYDGPSKIYRSENVSHVNKIFIIGMPRSGTSLIEQIVATHPAVKGGGEMALWTEVGSKHISAILAGGISDKDYQDIKLLADAYLCERSEGKSYITDKMPNNFMWLGIINKVYPEARILHLKRNPVDTCLSIYFTNFESSYNYAFDHSTLVHYYRQYHRLMEHWRSVLPPDIFMDVPYEEVIEDQEGWSRKIIDFIGLEWDDRCLEFYKTERRIGTASNWQARQPIYKTSKERWRNYEKYVGPLLPLLELYNCNGQKTR